MRTEGFALDLEEYAENLCCLSVPVRDAHNGEIAAAISVAMPKIRFKPQPRAALACAARGEGGADLGPLGLVGN